MSYNGHALWSLLFLLGSLVACNPDVYVETPAPSPEGTASLTPAASPSPGVSLTPSPTPTAEPSPTPTAEPSPTPTAEPSPTPTAEPSPTPMAEPSPTPTAEPSPTPTAETQTPTETTAPTPSLTPSPTPSETPSPLSIDNDEDGFSELDGDCDDLDPNTSPDGEELAYDGIDQDCSGEDLIDVDEDGAPGVASEAPQPVDCDGRESGPYLCTHRGGYLLREANLFYSATTFAADTLNFVGFNVGSSGSTTYGCSSLESNDCQAPLTNFVPMNSTEWSYTNGVWTASFFMGPGEFCNLETVGYTALYNSLTGGLASTQWEIQSLTAGETCPTAFGPVAPESFTP